MRLFTLIILIASAALSHAEPAPKRIHLFVALCDNASQGIQPVGKKIGNGDDPEANLYWGCDDGAASFFTRSKLWTLIEKKSDISPVILRRAIFKHKKTGTILVADAYRGREIKQCLTDFLQATDGRYPLEIEIKDSGKKAFGATADLVAYIGHNGLMEFKIPAGANNANIKHPDAIVLCCLSDHYFAYPLEKVGSRPLLLTRQLMYPGSFLLHDAIEGWLLGESRAKLRDRAARAYVKNQSISLKAARGIFADLE